MTSVTILPEDYDGLKKEYLVIRKELDGVSQELYVTKRQLKVVEALQLEYQSEIEILQSEENSQRLKQEEKIAHLEEHIGNVKSKYVKQIQTLEFELASKEAENEKLKAEVENLKKDNVIQTSTDEIYKLLEEVTSLKQEKEVLLEHEEKLNLSLEILKKNNLTLEEALTECKEELLHIKESLSCKREELMEANDLVQKLNDELFCLKSELESYKNKPLNVESKGNSLFAEVDDRRVYLQKTINNMKSEYLSIKQERAKHLNMISHLKKENKSLCEQLKKDMEDKEEDQYTVIKAYKEQIQTLENLLEKYKQDLAVKPLLMSSGNCKDFDFYQIMLNNKLKQIEELREELKSKGLNQVLLATALKEADKETRKWRLEATLKKYQLELQPGDSASEDVLMKKAEEEISGPRMELKQIMNWPLLACKNEEEAEFYVCKRPSVKKENLLEHSEGVKEVMIDSKHNIEDENREHSVEDKALYRGARKYDENVTNTAEIERDMDENVHVKEEAADLVENVHSNIQIDEKRENITKRVTFTETTVSPKATDRTALRAKCKRVVLPQPVYFPSE